MSRIRLAVSLFRSRYFLIFFLVLCVVGPTFVFFAPILSSLARIESSLPIMRHRSLFAAYSTAPESLLVDSDSPPLDNYERADTILQYHLKPPAHESLDEIPYPRRTSYYSINLNGLIPEFSALYPPLARLWLSFYGVRYDFKTQNFHIITMFHCVPAYVDKLSDSGCRYEAVGKLNGYQVGSQLQVRFVETELNFISTGLLCAFPNEITNNNNNNQNNNNQNDNDNDNNNSEFPTMKYSKARLRINWRSPAEIICKYPLAPSLPNNNSVIAIQFRGPERVRPKSPPPKKSNKKPAPAKSTPAKPSSAAGNRQLLSIVAKSTSQLLTTPVANSKSVMLKGSPAEPGIPRPSWLEINNKMKLAKAQREKEKAAKAAKTEPKIPAPAPTPAPAPASTPKKSTPSTPTPQTPAPEKPAAAKPAAAPAAKPPASAPTPSPPVAASKKVDTIGPRVRDLQNATQWRWRLIHSLPMGILTFPVLFEIKLPIISNWDKKFNVVYCSAPLRTDSYINNIEEFIDHHIYVGIEHFTFLDRNGLYRQFLDSHIKAGLVSYIHTPVDPSWPFTQHFDQVYLLETCRYRYFRSSKWIGLFDLDEFLTFPRIGNENKLFASTCSKVAPPGPLEGTLIADISSSSSENTHNNRHRTLMETKFIESFQTNPFTYQLPNTNINNKNTNKFIEITPFTPSQYYQRLHIPCRSLITDLLLEMQLFDSFRSSHSIRVASIPVGKLTQRSPAFYQAYSRAERAGIATSINTFDYPLSLTYTWNDKMSPPKSFFPTNSECRVELHSPHSCLEEKQHEPNSDPYRFYQIIQIPLIDRDRVFFLHYQNIVSHRQSREYEKKFKIPDMADRVSDLGRILFNKNGSNIYNSLTHYHQWNYSLLDNGKPANPFGIGSGVIVAGAQIYMKIQEMKESVYSQNENLVGN